MRGQASLLVERVGQSGPCHPRPRLLGQKCRHHFSTHQHMRPGGEARQLAASGAVPLRPFWLSGLSRSRPFRRCPTQHLRVRSGKATAKQADEMGPKTEDFVIYGDSNQDANQYAFLFPMSGSALYKPTSQLD